MRMEYIIVAFVLVLIVLVVALTMLSGVIPGFSDLLKLLQR